MADINLNLSSGEAIVDQQGKPKLGFLAKWMRKLNAVGDIFFEGSRRDRIVALAANDVGCTLGNYFTKSVAGATTFTFSDPPEEHYEFILEMLYASGTITMPASVKWPASVTPTWVAGTWKVTFSTSNQGTKWLADAKGPYA